MKAKLEDIEAFLRVVDTGSFTAAARAVDRPTSTISRRVARLEAALETRLLNRTTRRLSLTEPGRVFRVQAARALGELEDAEQVLAQAHGHPSGLVRAVAPAEFDGSLAMCAEFLRLYPDVRLDLELTGREVNLVRDGYDAQIHPGAPGDSATLIGRKLLESHLHLAASPEYLARHPAPTQPAELVDHDCIWFGSEGSRAQWTLNHPGIGAVEVALRPRLSVNNLQAARSAAVLGLGIALLPAIVCNRDFEDGGLRPVLPEASPDPISLWLLYPGGRHLAPAVRAFVDFVTDWYRSLASDFR